MASQSKGKGGLSEEAPKNGLFSSPRGRRIALLIGAVTGLIISAAIISAPFVFGKDTSQESTSTTNLSPNDLDELSKFNISSERHEPTAARAPTPAPVAATASPAAPISEPTTPPPTVSPSEQPSSGPSTIPSSLPTEAAGSDNAITTFYAIGDVPYTPTQAVELEQQLIELPADAEFLIHVGDLRDSGPKLKCMRDDYAKAESIFRRSHAPVFVIIGDNDWTDCPNREEGLHYWKQHFVGFESRYWNHTFDIMKQAGRPENFAFIHKGTLFVGLNIVGAPLVDRLEWTTRLTEEAEWTIDLIRNYTSTSTETKRVVIFGHANPNSIHRQFFSPLEEYIEFELLNQVPVLYLNGDRHKWSYDENYMGQPSFVRMMLTGRTYEPPLKVMVHATSDHETVQNAFTKNAFQYDRRLPENATVPPDDE
jgi:hypothetical protein